MCDNTCHENPIIYYKITFPYYSDFLIGFTQLTSVMSSVLYTHTILCYK